MRILTLSLFPLFFLFLSFKYPEVENKTVTYKKVTVKEFYTDAYNFHIRNRLEIPEHYYDILNIKNPNKVIVPITPIVYIPEVPKEKTVFEQVPDWVIMGVAFAESSSYYKDGNLVYVNKRRGGGSAIGPFQMKKIAFNEIKKKGENFWNLEKDMIFAEEMACRYLLFIYNGRGNKDWNRTVMMYTTGPYGLSNDYSRASAYLRTVKKATK